MKRTDEFFMSTEDPPTFKISLMGPASVGKTSLLIRFTKDHFVSDDTPTVGAAFASTVMKTSKGVITLNIWDTAGQEKYRSLVPQYARGSVAILLVFDLSEQRSFDEAIRIYREEKGNFSESVIWYLVGNKSDLMENHEPSSFVKFMDFPESNAFTFFHTSAKTGDNVKALFQNISESLVNSNAFVQQNKDSIRLESTEETLIDNKKGCC